MFPTGFHTRGLGCAAILATCLGMAVPALAIDATLRRCDARNFPSIFLNLAVTTEIDGVPGQAIEPPLQTGNFRCTEDGEPQTDGFAAVRPGDSGGIRGADVIFLVDASTSMTDEIAAVRSNIEHFVDMLVDQKLEAGLGLVRFGGGDGAPFVFNSGSLLSGSLMKDRDRFKGFLDQLGPIPGTGYEPGFGALREAISEFSFQTGTQKIFILITDEDSDGPAADVHADAAEKAETVRLLQDNQVRVFTAVNCNQDFSASDYCDATSVTAATKGIQFAVTDPFTEVLDVIAAEVGDTYVLSYRSSNPAVDGKERLVRCTATLAGQEDSVECTYTPKSAPEIDLTLETKGLTARRLDRGAQPKIAAIVTDKAEPLVQSVTLFYRTTGSVTYASLPMVLTSNDVYEAKLPPVAPPGVDFYVRATDGDEFTSLPSLSPGDEPFQIAVAPNSAPFIGHDPRAGRRSRPGENVTITSLVRDTTNSIGSVELRWRNEGDLFFKRLPMTRVAPASRSAASQASADTEGTFTAVIPGAEVTGPVEYYIRATDDQGVTSTFGTPDEPCPDCQVFRGLIAIPRPDTRPLPNQ